MHGNDYLIAQVVIAGAFSGLAVAANSAR